MRQSDHYGSCSYEGDDAGEEAADWTKNCPRSFRRTHRRFQNCFGRYAIHFNIHFNSVGWKFGRLYSVRANVELVCHDLSKNSLLRVNSRGRDKAVHFIGYVVVESEILRSVDELSSTLTTSAGHIHLNGANGMDRYGGREMHLCDRCDRHRLTEAHETFTDIQCTLGRSERQPCQDEQ